MLKEMKVLQKQTYQTYVAITTHEYIVDDNGKKYLAVHNVGYDGQESFEYFITDPNDILYVSEMVHNREIKEKLFEFVRQMHGEVEY